MVNNSNAENVLCQAMITRTVPNKVPVFSRVRKRDIESGGIMKTRIIALVIIALGTFGASGAEGQALRDVFKRVNASVVVIRSVQSEVIAGPQSQPVMAAGLGSGVLISKDGEIMTALPAGIQRVPTYARRIYMKQIVGFIGLAFLQLMVACSSMAPQGNRLL
jgi:hypothetical protein